MVVLELAGFLLIERLHSHLISSINLKMLRMLLKCFSVGFLSDIIVTMTANLLDSKRKQALVG